MNFQNPPGSFQVNEPLPYIMDSPLSSATLCFIVTNNCNLNCSYCFNYLSEGREDMTPETATGILKAYLESGEQRKRIPALRHIIFFGGEPTLNIEAIRSIMKYINSHHIDCVPRLVTNGVIDRLTLAELVEELFYFQVSFDGFGSQFRKDRKGRVNINSRIRETLRCVAEAGLPIFLRATVHAGNVGDMTDIVRFAHAHGVNTVAFTPVALMGNAVVSEIQRPDMDSYVENYYRALDTALHLGVNFYSSEMFHYHRGGSSRFPPLVWFPDGYLAFTIKYSSSRGEKAQKVIVGKYHVEQNRIIIDSEKIAGMAMNFINNRSRHCGDCPALALCKGNLNFDLFSTNPRVEAYDTYYCRITGDIVKRLEHYDLSTNNPY